MAIEIRQVGPDLLEQYGQIPMRHRVESVFRVDEIDSGLGGLTLTEMPFDQAYVKDHDENPEEGVSSWTSRFDVSNWLFLIASDGDKAAGGATLAFRSPKVNMLQGRDDLAVLWDIRVHPDYKRQGLGSRLINWAADGPASKGASNSRSRRRTITYRHAVFTLHAAVILEQSTATAMPRPLALHMKQC